MRIDPARYDELVERFNLTAIVPVKREAPA